MEELECIFVDRLFDSAKALAFENVPTREEVRVCMLDFWPDEKKFASPVGTIYLRQSLWERNFLH